MSMPSYQLLERLKASEGFRSQPYVCPAGRATIGYGHNLEAHPSAIRAWDVTLADQVKAGGLKGMVLVRRLLSLGMVWDKDHAEKWLREDMLAVMDELSARCPAYRHLTNLAAAAHAGRSEGPWPLSVSAGGRPSKCADGDGPDGTGGGGEGLSERMDAGDARKAEVRAEVLVDMAFNMGVAGLLGFRNTLARVARDDYEGAASGMLASKWAGQVGRRAAELARQMRTGERE